jgi:hypothetical protein
VQERSRMHCRPWLVEVKVGQTENLTTFLGVVLCHRYMPFCLIPQMSLNLSLRGGCDFTRGTIRSICILASRSNFVIPHNAKARIGTPLIFEVVERNKSPTIAAEAFLRDPIILM